MMRSLYSMYRTIQIKLVHNTTVVHKQREVVYVRYTNRSYQYEFIYSDLPLLLNTYTLTHFSSGTEKLKRDLLARISNMDFQELEAAKKFMMNSQPSPFQKATKEMERKNFKKQKRIFDVRKKK